METILFNQKTTTDGLNEAQSGSYRECAKF